MSTTTTTTSSSADNHGKIPQTSERLPSYAEHALRQSPTGTLPHSVSSSSTPHPGHLEAAPAYAPLDALAHAFCLRAPLIYATQTSQTARYQLQQEFTHSGRPSKLHIRRLTASESRALTRCSPGTIPAFDEDEAMFTVTKTEMKAHHELAERGRIELEYGIGLGGRWCRIYLISKSRVRDSLDPKNEARMQKYGYHAKEEWDRRLLYAVRGGIWTSPEGKRIAQERNGEFRIEEMKEVKRKDFLISCWIMKIWRMDGLRW